MVFGVSFEGDHKYLRLKLPDLPLIDDLVDDILILVKTVESEDMVGQDLLESQPLRIHGDEPVSAQQMHALPPGIFGIQSVLEFLPEYHVGTYREQLILGLFELLLLLLDFLFALSSRGTLNYPCSYFRLVSAHLLELPQQFEPERLRGGFLNELGVHASHSLEERLRRFEKVLEYSRNNCIDNLRGLLIHDHDILVQHTLRPSLSELPRQQARHRSILIQAQTLYHHLPNTTDSSEQDLISLQAHSRDIRASINNNEIKCQQFPGMPQVTLSGIFELQ